MRKNIKITAAFALTATGLFIQTSNASVIDLTFEGIGDNSPIGNYYNGGGGGNFGITFGSDSLAIISNGAGGSGNFSPSAPSSGVTVAFFLSGPGDVMNVAAGFDTGFSFYYADQVGFTGSVSVYDDLDGTGALLATLSLPSTPTPYEVFVPVGVTFSGTAKSVVFSGAANFIAFDDITLGSSTPGAVPDTGGTFAAFSLGALGLVAMKRMKI